MATRQPQFELCEKRIAGHDYVILYSALSWVADIQLFYISIKDQAAAGEVHAYEHTKLTLLLL